MFKEIEGNAWNYYEAGAHICITTNGTIQGNEIVFGAGIAEQARKRWNRFPITLASMHKAYGQHTILMEHRLISFPVKHNWWEEGNIELIGRSYAELVGLIKIYHLQHVILPRPGCGNGKLDWADVKEYLANCYLPDPVYANNISIITNHSVEKALAAGNQYG